MTKIKIAGVTVTELPFMFDPPCYRMPFGLVTFMRANLNRYQNL